MKSINRRAFPECCFKLSISICTFLFSWLNLWCQLVSSIIWFSFYQSWKLNTHRIFNCLISLKFSMETFFNSLSKSSLTEKKIKIHIIFGHWFVHLKLISVIIRGYWDTTSIKLGTKWISYSTYRIRSCFKPLKIPCGKYPSSFPDKYLMKKERK